MTIESNLFESNKNLRSNYIIARDKKSQNGITKEEILLNDIQIITEKFVNLENSKEKLVKIILKNFKDLDFSQFIKYSKFYIEEGKMKNAISPSKINGLNIVSVDGSSVIKNFMNVDFYFLKAIAVKYRLYKNHDAIIEFFPDLDGFNNYFIQCNYINQEEKTVELMTSIDMNFIEIQLLNSLIEESSDIDLIIIDGSIVIMPINLVFSKDPEVSRKYDLLLKEYQKLYMNCKEKGILLVGSIKDTRTSALSNLIRDSIQLLKPSHDKLSDFLKIEYRQLLDYFSDLDLFNRILKKSERSCIFNCKREIEKIRDEGIKKEIPYYFPLDFYAFYLKSAKFDVPNRIEFFTEENTSPEEASKKADLISSILLPISNLNDHYGLPIPQIEAHKRSVFRSNELNLLFNNLARNLNTHGISLLEKRRNRRPF